MAIKQPKLSARGRSKQAHDAILRLFHGIPVVDAKRPLRVTPLASDIKGATTKDPRNCVLARACRRMFGSGPVLFFRSIAYVELKDENGRSRVERYVLGQKTRRDVAVFDKTKKADPAGYTLNPPAKGQTLEYKRRYQADWKARPPTKKYKRPLQVSGDFEVRSGHGQVHFERIRGFGKVAKKA